MKFSQEISLGLADLMRDQAVSLDQVPDWVQAYFYFYRPDVHLTTDETDDLYYMGQRQDL